MKKILIGLVVVLGLAGIAAAIYFYLKSQDAPIPFIGKAYPKEDPFLEKTVSLYDDGSYFVKAENRADLFYTQGLIHGIEGGKSLVALRQLFRGEPHEHLPENLKDLAELFYYLDLEHLSTQSMQLYPAKIQVMIEHYAKGLSKTSKVKWTALDVLMMQRGYAFLLGRNFVKEWSYNQILGRLGQGVIARISNYPNGAAGGVANNVELRSSILPLFSRPLLETVRILSEDGFLALETRSIPYLSFVFQPMALSLDDNLMQGLSLAGTPFLWSGRNKAITYVMQPILANDEQFHQVPKGIFLGREANLFNSANASQVKRYQEMPVHSQYGRRITPMVIGNKDVEFYYYWDGFRPSADLATLYNLMEARNLDEGLSHLQNHQVPAVDVILSFPGSPRMNRRLFPADANVAESRMTRRNRLFNRPFVSKEHRRMAIQGLDFSSDLKIELKKWNLGRSPNDEALIELLRYYLDGPLVGGGIPAKVREKLSAVLAKDDETRQFLVQLTWAEMFEQLNQNLFMDEGAYIISSQSLSFQSYLLGSFGRDDNSWQQGPINVRSEFIELVIGQVYRTFNKLKGENPDYTLTKPDASTTSTKFSILSRDGAPGTYQVEGQKMNTIATQLMIWGQNFFIWRQPEAKNGVFVDPEKSKPEEGVGTSYEIKSKR